MKAATPIAGIDVPRVVGQAREQMICGYVENLNTVTFADSVDGCRDGVIKVGQLDDVLKLAHAAAGIVRCRL
jgi:hypothetical protein